jgi:AcrR family transcriptional regulator
MSDGVPPPRRNGSAAGKPEGGRVNQKWRTRTALLAAASDILKQGGRPTIAEVADAARVSRATAYRYFESQDALLVEASTEGPIVPALDAVAGEIGDSPDVAERLDRLVRAFQGVVQEHEPALRTLLRLTLEEPHEGHTARVRGSYRPYWLDQVLAPLGQTLTGAKRTRLVAALSLCMGPEAQIVLTDLNKLTADEAERVCRWAAKTLLDAAVRDLAAPDAD